MEPPDEMEDPPRPDEDLVEASHHIDERMLESNDYKKMRESLKTQRLISLFLGILVGVILIISVFSIWASVRANSAANQAQQSLSQQHATCLANNDFRKQDHKRWLYIESLVIRPTVSPSEEAFIKKFEAYIAKTDQLRDCSKVQ